MLSAGCVLKRKTWIVQILKAEEDNQTHLLMLLIIDRCVKFDITSVKILHLVQLYCLSRYFVFITFCIVVLWQGCKQLHIEWMLGLGTWRCIQITYTSSRGDWYPYNKMNTMQAIDYVKYLFIVFSRCYLQVIRNSVILSKQVLCSNQEVQRKNQHKSTSHVCGSAFDSHGKSDNSDNQGVLMLTICSKLSLLSGFRNERDEMTGMTEQQSHSTTPLAILGTIWILGKPEMVND